jgi:signal transduction histidine kinase
VDEAELLDPGYSPDGDWPGAPALGLGFALRLIRNLAEAVGGALVVDDERFALYLPVPAPSVEDNAQGESAG